jgi:hypothetical protein
MNTRVLRKRLGTFCAQSRCGLVIAVQIQAETSHLSADIPDTHQATTSLVVSESSERPAQESTT